MSDAPQSRHSRIDDIEVLRAFAVGLVLVQHLAGNLVPFMDGETGLLYGHLRFWSGVDLFFAISGFVIARSLLPLLPPPSDRGAFVRTAVSFWMRRAWRLLPSAWLWLAITVAASAIFNRSGAFGPVYANVSGAVAAIFYYANFHEAFGFGRIPLGAVFHYWSLSLEEQFYFALPFVVFLARNRLPTVLIAIVASQVFIRRVGPFGDLLFAHVRCDALCLGVLLAIWSGGAQWRRWEPTGLKPALARWLLPFGFMGVLAVVSGPMLGQPRCTMAIVALLAAGIVWVASYDRDYLFPKGAVKRMSCWLGARSYAVYLIHLPIYCATREFWSRTRPSVLQPSIPHLAILIAGALLTTLVLADLNYRFLETPLRRRGARIAERIRSGDQGAATQDRRKPAEPARANPARWS